MRAVKVDPTNRTVTEIDLTCTTKGIRQAIGCQVFTGAGELDNGDYAYCDDEFMYTNPQHFVELGHNADLVGSVVLITGSDGEGGTTACKSTVEEIEKDIIWYNLADIRNMG